VGLCADGLGASSASNVIPISPVATILQNSFISALLCTQSLPDSELWKEEAGGVEVKGFAEQNRQDCEHDSLLTCLNHMNSRPIVAAAAILLCVAVYVSQRSTNSRLAEVEGQLQVQQMDML